MRVAPGHYATLDGLYALRDGEADVSWSREGVWSWEPSWSYREEDAEEELDADQS